MQRPTASLTRNPPTPRPRPRALPPNRAVSRLRRARRKRSGSCCRRPSSPRHQPRLLPRCGCAESAAPAETAVAPEERRDANDLARAAIERLRVNGDGSPRAPGSRPYSRRARGPERPRPEAPRSWRRRRSGRCRRRSWSRPRQPPASPMFRRRRRGRLMPANAEAGDPRRPTPPAEIPLSRPLDLRAEAAGPVGARPHHGGAEDVLSAAKSVFHAVLPK